VSEPAIAVVGGSVSGLAAAERLRTTCDVTLIERQEYSEKRVNCGEAISEAGLIPLAKEPANGFHNEVEAMDVELYPSRDRPEGSEPAGRCSIRFPDGYVTDRNLVERRWAERLAAAGVTIEEGRTVTTTEFEDLVAEYDYVVDASGQPALSLRTFDRAGEYTGDIVALNAEVEGDFSGAVRRPKVFFEGYVGYSWVFPKSRDRANVGVGWDGDDRPDDYVAAFRESARRNGFPVPDREDVNLYTIPRGPSLPPRRVHLPEKNVFLVGDAAGIANRYQGEGICQGIRSSYLLADLIEAGEESSYPSELYDAMRDEYRLAYLMRGVLEAHGDQHLVASLAESLDGLTITDVTRRPSVVLRRLSRRPGLTSKLLTDVGMVRRIVDAYRESWEFEA
jgi:digeranylgeranylglycerophospholipid reductase